MIPAGPPSKRPPHSGLARFVGGAAWFGTALLVLLLGLPAAIAAGDETLTAGEFIPVTPPQPAPQVAFTDPDGKAMTVADFKGKPLIINFWATWCTPCLKEMPSLERLQSNLAGRLVIAAVAQDRLGAQRVIPFAAEKGLNKLKIYLDPKAELGRAFGSRGLPTSIIIDAEGRVVGRVEGAVEWDSAEIMARLKPYLAGGRPGA
jgi:thiol-disulfide isomerase/thioredoxin